MSDYHLLFSINILCSMNIFTFQLTIDLFIDDLMMLLDYYYLLIDPDNILRNTTRNLMETFKWP